MRPRAGRKPFVSEQVGVGSEREAWFEGLFPSPPIVQPELQVRRDPAADHALNQRFRQKNSTPASGGYRGRRC